MHVENTVMCVYLCVWWCVCGVCVCVCVVCVWCVVVCVWCVCVVCVYKISLAYMCAGMFFSIMMACRVGICFIRFIVHQRGQILSNNIGIASKDVPGCNRHTTCVSTCLSL